MKNDFNLGTRLRGYSGWSSTLLSPYTYTKNKFSPDEAQFIMHTINHGVIIDGCLIPPPTLHKVQVHQIEIRMVYIIFNKYENHLAITDVTSSK